MFTNKHVVVALIVAPILAVLAWLAIGSFLGEQPHMAEAGMSYPLVARSNCRYDSGRCDLQNEDFSLSLQLENNITLVVSSKHPLRGVMVSVGDASIQLVPSPMRAVSSNGMRWRLQLPQLPRASDVIRLVAATEQNSYYGETSTQFIAL
ncbi:MAG: hypothetical protein ACJASY_003852 [Halioglobus sp.]|jgi:hypothetical protein